MLLEKELEIQNYQRQNLQLQMLAGPGSSTGSAQATYDPFAAIGDSQSISEDSTTRIAELEQRLQGVLRELTEKQAKINELETLLASHASEAGKNLRAECTDLQRQLCEKDVEIARLQDLHQHLLSSLPSEPEIVAASTFTVHGSNEPRQAAISLPSAEHHDQQIEDLQRNVSDLEKYVTDLENKLKSSHDEISRNANERSLLESNFASRTAQLEQQLTVLRDELALANAERQMVQSQTEVIAVHSTKTLPTASKLFAPSSATTTADDPFSSIQTSNVDDAADAADGKQPVVEDVIVPKKAYLCHPTDENERQTFSPQSVHTDDAWGETGWGGDDAALEEEHQRLTFTENQSRGLGTAELKLQLQVKI